MFQQAAEVVEAAEEAAEVAEEVDAKAAFYREVGFRSSEWHGLDLRYQLHISWTTSRMNVL